MSKINLGDEVKHTITGVKGIATAKTEFISGCCRITIQQKVLKDGSLPDGLTFDEPEIEIIKKKNLKRKTNTGGYKPEIKRSQTKYSQYKNK